jgi:hypothetical protein
MPDDKGAGARTTTRTADERLADAVEPTADEQAQKLADDRARIRKEHDERREAAGGQPVTGR